MRVRENLRDDPELGCGFRFPVATDNGVAGTALFVFLFCGVLETALHGLFLWTSFLPVKVVEKRDADDDGCDISRTTAS